MGEAPVWSVLVLPAVLAVGAFAAVVFDAALEARAAGRPLSVSAAVITPLRAVVRLLITQRRTITAADVVLWRTGVVLVPVAAVLAGLVVPLGGKAVSDLAVGVVWFNAMEILAWAAVWMAGWGPNAALSLVGGYRFVAQGLAYELPHMFALITTATAASTLRVGGIVEAQSDLWFVVWMPVAFVVYLLSAMAMAFWGPFDAPLGRDLAGGAAGELSGVDRLVFLGGRWLPLVVAVAMAVPLFLGGGHGPWLPGWVWTVLKTAVVLGVVVWAGRRFPTVRMERFAELAWVVLVPLTILQALVVALLVLIR